MVSDLPGIIFIECRNLSDSLHLPLSHVPDLVHPTSHLTISELHDQEISQFSEVQERRGTDFGASKL